MYELKIEKKKKKLTNIFAEVKKYIYIKGEPFIAVSLCFQILKNGTISQNNVQKLNITSPIYYNCS